MFSQLDDGAQGTAAGSSNIYLAFYDNAETRLEHNCNRFADLRILAGVSIANAHGGSVFTYKGNDVSGRRTRTFFNNIFESNVQQFPTSSLSSEMAVQDEPLDLRVKKEAAEATQSTHQQSSSIRPRSKPHVCPECGKGYISKGALRMHTLTHTPNHHCPICEKSFSQACQLRYHVRTHTGEKPFKCPVCAKAFTDKSNFRAHVRLHSQIKPYACMRCGMGFALKSYLGKHKEVYCMRMRALLRRSPVGAQSTISTAPPASYDPGESSPNINLSRPSVIVKR